jgi:hypothetical protein
LFSIAEGNMADTRKPKHRKAGDRAQAPKSDRHNQGTAKEFEQEGMGVAAKE